MEREMGGEKASVLDYLAVILEAESKQWEYHELEGWLSSIYLR